MIIVAGLVPVVIELVSQAVPRLRGGSFTPVVFAFTGVLVAWGLFRYRMFDVVPLARDLVLENMLGLVFVVDGNGRVVDLNPAAQRAVGLEPLNVIGHPARGVLRDWTGLPVDLIATEFTVGETDKRRVYDMKVSPIKNNEGDVVGRLLLLHDITERKRMEEELRRHTEHLEELVIERTRELNLSQERLLQAERLAAIGKTAGMVAHDLRNPLQGMTSTLYLAKQTLKSPKAKAAEKQEAAKLLETLDEEIAYMGKIVEDLQDYARPLTPDLAETSLPDLIRETFSTMKVPENVKVSIQVEKDIGNVMVDAGLMRRVLTNLTTNSIQSMPKGGRLTIRADKTRNVTVIAVEDTGVGISEEDLGKLFEPFFTTKAKGQGFGLPVCKRLVEAHGGTITAESKPGKGSTFTIKIPLNKNE
jgi:PAS domain S-box-containing protein